MIDQVVNALTTVFTLVTGSSSATLLSIVGLALLFLTGWLAYVAVKSKPDEMTPLSKNALFVALVGGMVFSAAGASAALLYAKENAIAKMDAEQAFKNLEDNAQVNYVIRLISFDPSQEPGLSIDRLVNLGPPDQLYSFVASYDELVGYRVSDALTMVGQSNKGYNRVSAIIFPLRTPLYPANARGLVQVVQEVENRKDVQTQLTKKLFDGANTFNSEELTDLEKHQIPTYALANFQEKYKHYCELARKFNCDRSYSARAFVGGLNEDWNPLGFSQRNPKSGRCDLPTSKYCEFSDWKQTREVYRRDFGSRAFLIRNLEIKNIPGRILIDFDNPNEQVIPDIGRR